jgi:aryl-alcohol dehydrogenase-like predicted oxidoreductase
MIKRRHALKTAAALAAMATLPRAAVAQDARIVRRIPSTGAALPVIGMGSWLTFHVFSDREALAVRTAILREFFARGGALLDSSPMYGRSEAVLGHCLGELGQPEAAFTATKVWIIGRQFGINQMEHSESLWGQGGFDLMQVHNLLDWDTQLETLKTWKAAGRIRYIGVTTSHGRRHDELERIMRAQPLDFVQFTYNFSDRGVEERLLPLAAERGIAVIINRPFNGGSLFDAIAGNPLPGWAPEIGCANWAQVFLKFVISHSAVTCAIPATSKVAHMQENMGALAGALPDAALRKRMLADFQALT